MDARDGDGADASDAGEPRLLESSHRAISDGLGGFVVTTDLPALLLVSKTVRDSRLLVAIKRAVTTRCTAHAASKRARRRLEAVDVMGHFLGPEAEGFLSAIFRNDKLQTVRAAAAKWLARVARRADPLTKERIFAVACERYDAEAGRMTVLQAIRDAFTDVYDSSAVARMHPTGGALAKFVVATLAAREDRLRRQREASKAAAAGAMGGRIHLFREDADFRRVHFKIDKGRDDSLKLAFANPLERSVLLRRYESTGLRGDQRLEVVEIPPRSVRHFATIEFPKSSRKPTADVPQDATSTAGLPEGRWRLRVPPLGETGILRLPDDQWIFNGTGLLRLDARLRQRDDPRGAQDCHGEPPFELWTFELRPEALTCRVDRPGNCTLKTDRAPYQPQAPPPPPPARWWQSLREERVRLRVPPPSNYFSVGEAVKVRGEKLDKMKRRDLIGLIGRISGVSADGQTYDVSYAQNGESLTAVGRVNIFRAASHTEWLPRYPDVKQLIPMDGQPLVDIDRDGRPGEPREFFFYEQGEPQPRTEYNSWPAPVDPSIPTSVPLYHELFRPPAYPGSRHAAPFQLIARPN